MVLLILSVSSWVVILYKSWWLWRVSQDLPVAQQAFWQSASPQQACDALSLLDRQAVLLPLAQPLMQPLSGATPGGASLHGAIHLRERGILQALREVTVRAEWGQAWLASIASAAPFVGLLGTVWGLQDAMAAISPSGELSAAELSRPLAQALGLTASGILVALPALMAYNLMGQRILSVRQSMEDFAEELLSQEPACVTGAIQGA